MSDEIKINNLSLAAIRRQINASTRDVTFMTDDGSPCQMVYIPKFTIPADFFYNGENAARYPAEDLDLGGFFIDKYQCSHKAATSASMGCAQNLTVSAGSTTDIALSLPGKRVWIYIQQPYAKIACANRKIKGQACHLTTMKEWATIALLSAYLGHDIRGNNSNGFDVSDEDTWANYGVPYVAYTSGDTSYSQILTGTGPNSYSHNGMANGVFDIVGNAWEWCDWTMSDGVYTDTKGTRRSINPGGCTAFLAATINASATTLTFKDLVMGPNGVTFKAGDLIICYNEVMKVTAINGSTLTVLRGQEGSTAASHNADVAINKIPAEAEIYSADTTGDYGVHVRSTISALYEEAGAGELALPGECSDYTEENALWKDGFWYRPYGTRAAIRGGCANNGLLARSGFAMNLANLPSDYGWGIGFRAALSL